MWPKYLKNVTLPINIHPSYILTPDTFKSKQVFSRTNIQMTDTSKCTARKYQVDMRKARGSINFYNCYNNMINEHYNNCMVTCEADHSPSSSTEVKNV